jgi:thiol-disulfide isomerase/thioredoxin
MKKTIIFIAVATLCLFFRGFGQTNHLPGKDQLDVGDRVPDLVFKTILNGDKKPLALSALKGKAVILDFWATWCSVCIKGFPKMNALQEKYNKILQVILVADSQSDTEKKVSKFVMDREEAADALVLPVAYNDSLTKVLFPHLAFPHYVWIGADRKVKAITRWDAFTEENVSAFLAGRDLFIKKKEL